MVAAAGLRLIGQPVDAGLDEPTPNPRHRFRRQVQLHRDVDPAGPRGAQPDDASAPDDAGRGRRTGEQRLQLLLLLAGDLHAEGSMRHPQNRSHA